MFPGETFPPPDLKGKAAFGFPPLSMGSNNKRLKLGVSQRDLALDPVLGHVPQLERALNCQKLIFQSCFFCVLFLTWFLAL